jgi:hypothetical protein
MRSLWPILPAALFAACAASHDPAKPPTERDDERDVQALSDAAGAYWRALRWGDADTAKAFVEDEAKKLAFDEWLTEDVKTNKITDTEVLRITLDKVAGGGAPVEGHRGATVTVRTEGYRVDDLVVHLQTVDQQWYHTDIGWYVVWP